MIKQSKVINEFLSNEHSSCSLLGNSLVMVCLEEEEAVC